MTKTWTCALVLAAACSHSGGGQGMLETPTSEGMMQASGPVTFTWESKADPTTGKIQATMPDGTLYAGTFLQVTANATVDDLDPYYDAYVDPAWGGAWYDGAEDEFITEYTGQVVAHLSAANGTRMRCKFDLRRPYEGMTGGGEGDCQLSDNQEVFDARLKAKK